MPPSTARYGVTREEGGRGERRRAQGPGEGSVALRHPLCMSPRPANARHHTTPSPLALVSHATCYYWPGSQDTQAVLLYPRVSTCGAWYQHTLMCLREATLLHPRLRGRIGSQGDLAHPTRPEVKHKQKRIPHTSCIRCLVRSAWEIEEAGRG
eukprot:2492635-Rhodomonas_salina.1